MTCRHQSITPIISRSTNHENTSSISICSRHRRRDLMDGFRHGQSRQFHQLFQLVSRLGHEFLIQGGRIGRIQVAQVVRVVVVVVDHWRFIRRIVAPE